MSTMKDDISLLKQLNSVIMPSMEQIQAAERITRYLEVEANWVKKYREDIRYGGGLGNRTLIANLAEMVRKAHEEGT